jgi:hypothetical protein
MERSAIAPSSIAVIAFVSRAVIPLKKEWTLLMFGIYILCLYMFFIV